MASLNIKSFSKLVSEQVTAIQARALKLVDFSIGSILRSLAESNAGVAMWIQQLIVKLLVTTRAATCSGEDLDSWMADFSFPRLSAVQAVGQVTFSRFTATSQALIPLGAQVTTTDGTQHYAVIEDKTMSAWDPVQSGYVIAAGAISLVVPVQAKRAGAAGNAQPGTVTIISGAILYVDTVTNNTAFVNGKNAEGDDGYRARFVLWIASLSKATRAAIGFAISNLQNGVSYTLTENFSWNGPKQPGYFYAVVDDGSSTPSSEFLQRAYAAIDEVRGFTISFGVFRPVVIQADVIMVITTDDMADHDQIVMQVRTAIKQYIDSLVLGQLLSYTQLIKVAYGVSQLVTNVSSLTLNGGTADMAASHKEVIRPQNVVVS